MPEGFGQYIPPEARSEQYKAANFVIDNESKTELLTPPSVDRETILSLTVEEVKEQFPKRYEMYLKLVRELKHPESKNHPVNLTPKDVEDMKKWLLALNSIDNYITRHRDPQEGDEITLRGERQVDVFDDIRKFLERNEKEGYLKLPTGFGKTVLFTELVESTNLKSLIVVPTKLLITQTEKKFKQFAPDVTVGKVYGEEEKVYGQQATLITYDSLILGLDDGTINPKDYDLMILDEAHVILSEARSEAVAQFSDVVKLGFTATPIYEPGEKEVGNILGTEIHSIKIREAVEGGYLSSFSSIAARTEVDLSGVKVTASGEYNAVELAKAVDIESRNKAAVELYKQAFDGRLAVAYCVGVTHAENLAKLFNDSGVPSAYISGDTSVKEQEEIFKKYEAGEIKVLCNADLLIAGFDEPQASVCLNLRPTKSLVVAEQRGGRVLRLDENNPNKHAYIVDFIDWGYKKSGQILFPQVAEAIELEAKEKKEQEGRGGKGRVNFNHIKIDGIEVVVDQEVMLEIISNSQKENVEINGQWTNETLQKEVQNYIKMHGIQLRYRKALDTYSKLRAQNPSWPDIKSLYRMEGFLSLEKLLGIEKWTLGTLKKAIQDYVKLKNIKIKRTKTEKTYTELQKDNDTWPKPRNVYELKDFVSFADLLGISRWTFNELREEVQEFIRSNDIGVGLVAKQRYTELQKLNPHWPLPSRVVDMVEEFKSFPALFEVKSEIEKAETLDVVTDNKTVIISPEEIVVEDWTISKLKKQVRDAMKKNGKIISPGQSRKAYLELRADNLIWPSVDFVYKMKGFKSFEELLGAEKMTIKQLKKEVKEALRETGYSPNPRSAEASYKELQSRKNTLPTYDQVKKLVGFTNIRDILFGF
ncbi:MAG: DEAD/DEAH box helicase [Candidatus Magasanikbacteria bacterium]|nr:DEAD/DEAH box helicase [Candidatus Magasanikbacteria bacterium]